MLLNLLALISIKLDISLKGESAFSIGNVHHKLSTMLTIHVVITGSLDSQSHTQIFNPAHYIGLNNH